MYYVIIIGTLQWISYNAKRFVNLVLVVQSIINAMQHQLVIASFVKEKELFVKNVQMIIIYPLMEAHAILIVLLNSAGSLIMSVHLIKIMLFIVKHAIMMELYAIVVTTINI